MVGQDPAEEPAIVLGPQLGLKCLVKADVYQLEETGASGWNELHLDPKILNFVDNRCLHVHREGIKKEDGHNSFWRGEPDIRHGEPDQST